MPPCQRTTVVNKVDPTLGKLYAELLTRTVATVCYHCYQQQPRLGSATDRMGPAAPRVQLP